MNKRLILKLAGSVLLVEAALLFVPLIIALIIREGDWGAFALSIAVTLATGSALSMVRPRDDTLSAREGFAVVTLSWLFVSLCGALPFYFSGGKAPTRLGKIPLLGFLFLFHQRRDQISGADAW